MKRGAIRFPKVSEAALRRAWADSSMTAAEAAQSLGISCGALRDRAAHRGLPARRNGRPISVPVEEFSEMWNAGVGPKELAAHFGVAWPSSLFETARRLGLRRFARGEPRISLADFQMMKLAEAMRQSAQATRQTMKDRSK